MSGDAKNTSMWAGADIFIAPVGTAAPTDTSTAWAAAWKPVGLLDGEEGLTQSRDEESSEHYAWGGILYKRTKSKHKRSFRFVALEDNDTVFALVNPGSTRGTASGTRTSTIKVPTTAQFAVGMELREGGKVKRRTIKVAEVSDIADIKDSETDPTVYDITVLIFPESDGTLFTEIETAPAA